MSEITRLTSVQLYLPSLTLVENNRENFVLIFEKFLAAKRQGLLFVNTGCLLMTFTNENCRILLRGEDGAGLKANNSRVILINLQAQNRPSTKTTEQGTFIGGLLLEYFSHEGKGSNRKMEIVTANGTYVLAHNEQGVTHLLLEDSPEANEQLLADESC